MGFVGTLEFEKPWSGTMVLRPGCILEVPNMAYERALPQTHKIRISRSGAQVLFLLLFLFLLVYLEFPR